MATTVLIVDDSKLARIVAGKAIHALQPAWERVEAASADEAMDLLAKRQVDVVLVDFNMPGRNGLDFAADLRARYPTMPIAVITANVQDEVVNRVREIKATFVGKPLTEDGLRGFLSGAALRLKSAGP